MNCSDQHCLASADDHENCGRIDSCIQHHKGPSRPGVALVCVEEFGLDSTDVQVHYKEDPGILVVGLPEAFQDPDALSLSGAVLVPMLAEVNSDWLEIHNVDEDPIPRPVQLQIPGKLRSADLMTVVSAIDDGCIDEDAALRLEMLADSSPIPLVSERTNQERSKPNDQQPGRFYDTLAPTEFGGPRFHQVTSKVRLQRHLIFLPAIVETSQMRG